jgi:PAS domain S-box-containing protein
MEQARPNVTPLPGAGRRRGVPVPSEAERLAEVSSVLLASADAELRFTFLNGAWERLLGWLPEELAGSHALELVHPDDFEQTAAAFVAAREHGGAELDIEVRVATRDGRWRWMSWKVRFENGRWYGAGQDTTERRAQERELAASRERLAEAQRIAEVGAFELDVQRGELWWSDEHYRIHGLSPETYRPSVETGMRFIHPDDIERVRAAWVGVAGSGVDEGEIEYRIVRPDGVVRDVAVRATIAFDGDGQPARIAGTCQDVTDRHRAERALATREAQLRAVVEQVPAIVYTAGLGSNAPWEFVSPQIEALLGYSAEEWGADRELWWDVLHPDDRIRVLAEEKSVAEPGGRLRSEYRLRRRDGEWIWVRDEATAIEDENGELRFQGVLLDITETKRTEAALEQSERKYRDLVQASHDLIFSVDPEGRCTFVNDASADILGYKPAELVGRSFGDFMDREAAVAARETLAQAIAGRPVTGYEVATTRKDGGRVVLSANAYPVLDPDGAVVGVTGTARDITQQKRVQAAVEHKHAQLQQIIDNSPLVIWAKDREQRYLFSNREHDAAFGPHDGGSPIGLRDADFRSAAEARSFVASDTEVLAGGRAIELEERVMVRGRERVFLVHKFPLCDADGELEGVCGIATDITERKEREDALRAKVEWSFRIRKAIEHDRFELHSQPIVELGTGRVVQEELLLRMRAEDGRLIMPGEFLPPAERFELAPAIDRWVIGRAADVARTRRVEVNLSGQSIGDPGLPAYVEEQLERAGAEPGNLVFEITETTAAEDLDQASLLAERLASLGCGFALDDFGTGYGSFTYLKHLPVSYIKIDMEFVRNLRADSPDRQVVSAIVDVARNFGIETIAEGVESQDTLELLQALRVDFAQGFHIGRPSPA